MHGNCLANEENGPTVCGGCLENGTASSPMKSILELLILAKSLFRNFQENGFLHVEVIFLSMFPFSM